MYEYVPQIIVSSISNSAELYAPAYIIEVSSFVRDMSDLNSIRNGNHTTSSSPPPPPPPSPPSSSSDGSTTFSAKLWPSQPVPSIFFYFFLRLYNF
jgi:hypothetical protein